MGLGDRMTSLIGDSGLYSFSGMSLLATFARVGDVWRGVDSLARVRDGLAGLKPCSWISGTVASWS